MDRQISDYQKRTFSTEMPQNFLTPAHVVGQPLLIRTHKINSTQPFRRPDTENFCVFSFVLYFNAKSLIKVTRKYVLAGGGLWIMKKRWSCICSIWASFIFPNPLPCLAFAVVVAGSQKHFLFFHVQTQVFVVQLHLLGLLENYYFMLSCFLTYTCQSSDI